MRRLAVALVLLSWAFCAAAVAEEPFDETADELIASPSRYEWQQPRRVLQLLSIRSGERVGEIDAGKGFFTDQLAARVGETGRVYATESRPEMIPHLESLAAGTGRSNVEVIRAAADDLALPGELDLILAVNVWHHVEDRGAKREAVRRALKPGGRFVVVDWRTEEIPIGPPLAHRLARKTLIAEMEAAGWSLTTDARLLPYQYLLVFTPRKE